jgi:hypothetical protein
MQPAAALHPGRDHRHVDGFVRSQAAAHRPPVRHDDTPSYNDPSKFGGDAALSVMAEPPSTPSPAENSNAAVPVRVQPRGNAFTPNSDEVQVVQKRITDFNEMQRLQEEAFDRKLLICRRC